MRDARTVRALRESVAEYASAGTGGVTKLSISLPADLAETVRAAAEESGQSVSAVVAAALRRAVDGAERERLDAAIDAQNEENAEFARAYESVAARLWADLEW